MAYTADKKPGSLDAATTLVDGDNVIIDQSGYVKKATLGLVEEKVFSGKTAITTVSGTEVVVVRRTDDTLRQVALNNIIKPLLINNDMVSESAGIVDTKLATINTAGKVTNNAVQAVSTNTANRIVTRDGGGNFAAGTVTATLSGNASTATALATPRTIAISGDLTGTATSFDGSASVTIPAQINAGAIVDADINASAAIGLSKLATGALPTGITVASANLVEGTVVDADINASAAISLTKLATGALPTGITVASANLVTGTIVNADINASAAIDKTKINGTAITATDTGTVTSAMIADGTIVNGDINASAQIVDTKLATIATAGKVSNSATTATAANTANAIVARDASGNFTAGTMTGNVTGNAGTVTNGLYTNAVQNVTGAKSFIAGNSGMASATGGLNTLEVYGTGGAAMMTFHRPGAYAVYFGIDSDNVLKVGGWSLGNAAHRVVTTNDTGTVSAGMIAAGAVTAPKLAPIAFNTQAASYTVTAADAGTVILMNSASANTVSLPAGLPIGTQVTVIQIGTGQTSFAATGGAVLRTTDSFTKLYKQWSVASAIYVSVNNWVLAGDIIS